MPSAKRRMQPGTARQYESAWVRVTGEREIGRAIDGGQDPGAHDGSGDLVNEGWGLRCVRPVSGRRHGPVMTTAGQGYSPRPIDESDRRLFRATVCARLRVDQCLPPRSIGGANDSAGGSRFNCACRFRCPGSPAAGRYSGVVKKQENLRLFCSRHDSTVPEK